MLEKMLPLASGIRTQIKAMPHDCWHGVLRGNNGYKIHINIDDRAEIYMGQTVLDSLHKHSTEFPIFQTLKLILRNNSSSRL